MKPGHAVILVAHGARLTARVVSLCEHGPSGQWRITAETGQQTLADIPHGNDRGDSPSYWLLPGEDDAVMSSATITPTPPERPPRRRPRDEEPAAGE